MRVSSIETPATAFPFLKTLPETSTPGPSTSGSEITPVRSTNKRPRLTGLGIVENFKREASHCESVGLDCDIGESPRFFCAEREFTVRTGLDGVVLTASAARYLALATGLPSRSTTLPVKTVRSSWSA